ncbi:transcriptional regulator, LysR family [Desulfosarcina variabilis str. Montpellier]|uniref:LysR family transcriptional regulator n=1 Tax=Desulfosarcina variabilis TaxID=2300 RepID=UPI003AFB3528
MPLNINQLRSFYTAAKYESITMAASELMVTPAAITSQVKILEESIGLKLLFRSGHSMRLTDSGRKVYEETKEIFEKIDKLEVFMSNLSKGKTGTVKIGCSETAALYVIPKLLTVFQMEYPEIRVIIDRGTTHDMLRNLMDRKIDLILAHYLTGDKRLKMRYLGKKRISLITATQCSHLKHENISVNDLDRIPLILPVKGSATRKIIQKYLQQHGVTPKIVMETPSIVLTKTLVQNDEGVSFVCRQGVEEELANKKLKEIHIQESVPDIPYGIGYLKRRDLSEASLAFIRIIEKVKQENVLETE